MLFLYALPLGAAGHVGDLDALGLQFIADAVGLGKVLGLLGVSTVADQLLDPLRQIR